jgi:RNA polymerase sigma-70 factor (ECF subfamily)
MTDDPIDPLLSHLFREESGRLVASATRILGVARLDLAEDVVQDALAKAVREWRFKGLPENPGAWLQRVVRNRVLDVLRREASWSSKEDLIAAEIEGAASRSDSDAPHDGAPYDLLDDQLRMMFACCHPSLTPDSQVSLTLKALGGLSTAEIARAFLADERAIAQRIVRAKRTLGDARATFAIPAPNELPARLDGVLRVLYLIFNEGYQAHSGADPIRADLCEEAIRLVELLASHPVGDVARTHALAALLLFQASRLPARVDDDGNLFVLEEQDRSLWDRRLIDRAHRHLERAGRGEGVSTYHWEAAIAACHASAPEFARTDWRTIVECYDALSRMHDSPVIALNRAIAIAMLEGPARGIAEIERIREREGPRDDAHLFAALGKLHADLGDRERAAEFYEGALRESASDSTRRFLRSRIERLRARSD